MERMNLGRKYTGNRAGYRRREQEGGTASMVLAVQMLICILLIAAAWIVQLLGGDFYTQLQSRFSEMIQSPVTARQVEEQVASLIGELEEIKNQLLSSSSQAESAPNRADSNPDWNGQGGEQPISEEAAAAMPPPGYATFEPAVITAPLTMPVDAIRLTSGYGYRYHPITDKLDFHNGIDLAAPMGSTIRAVLPGTVEEVGMSEIWGNYIILRHSESLTTQYSHCSEIVAEQGTVLRQGETIAKVGSTGVSTGPHLHFDIKINGVNIDPCWVMEVEEGEL